MLARVAPVETDNAWHFNRPRPLVHDQNAALLNGVAGHAGLFSTTGDLVLFIRMMMQEGHLGTTEYFKPSTVRKFTSRSGSNERALGWDLRPTSGKSSAGNLFSSSSWGHLGYTGTSIWVDPRQELAVIFLCNRVYPTSANIKIRSFRPLLHDTVARSLGIPSAEEHQGH
jgi:CubicO group peptidase (beta-lactamase class C family)